MAAMARAGAKAYDTGQPTASGMLRPAVTAWRTRICAIVAGAGMALGASACGSSAPGLSAGETHGSFMVAVPTARFPAAQTLAGRTHLVIAVRNAGTQTIPNVSVTICNVTCAYPAPAGEGTSARAFAADISGSPGLADPSRPLWIVNRGPGPCGYSCDQGSQGTAATAYSNTWALGSLAPGKTARFEWAVTPVTAGHHVIAWEVAAGLSGNAKAVLSNGAPPHGAFTVDVSPRRVRTYVEPDGHVKTTP
jgi:hypothetical protein